MGDKLQVVNCGGIGCVIFKKIGGIYHQGQLNLGQKLKKKRGIKF